MQKVEETDIVLNEVEKVSHEYLPMAKACSSIFFTLSSLSTVRKEKIFKSFCETRSKRSVEVKRIPRLSVTLQYRVLSGDSFDSPIFSLQLSLAIALDRRPA